jgi:hypothetical protein
LIAKEQVLRSQSTAGMRRKESQADQINHDRRDCSEAVCKGSDQRKPGMNAQDDTLQNVTGLRFRFGTLFAEHRAGQHGSDPGPRVTPRRNHDGSIIDHVYFARLYRAQERVTSRSTNSLARERL